MDEISRAHQRATDLVRRILTFSRQQDSDKRVDHLEHIVQEAVHLLKVSMPKGVTLETSFPEGLPQVVADPTQLHQVVMNLGTNAIYAMKDRGGRLSLSLAARTLKEESTPSAVLRPGDYVELTVADTGSGIPPALLDRLFEPFFTTKGDKGTGLGLSVVHGIVREHGGDILVESTPDVGTTFTVYIPAISPAPR